MTGTKVYRVLDKATGVVLPLTFQQIQSALRLRRARALREHGDATVETSEPYGPVIVNGRRYWLDELETITNEYGVETYAVKVRYGGRQKGSDLAKRGDELLQWRGELLAADPPRLTQEKLAEKLQVQPVTVRRYFKPSPAWQRFKDSGELPTD